MKRWNWIQLVTTVSLVGLGLSGAVAALRQGTAGPPQASKPGTTTKSTKPAPNSPEVALVRVYRVRPAGRGSTLSLTGSVRPRFATDLAFRVSGKVSRRLVEVGEVVSPGQTLLELDTEDFRLQQQTAQANLQVAQAALVQATAEEKRQAELRRSNAVSASEYDRALSERDIALGRLESARRQLDLADNQLSYCQLNADAAGVVTAISAEAGQVLTLGSPVCTVAQIGQLEASVDVPENRWSFVNDLETVATFWSLPGVSCRARLREIAPTADPITRTYRARFTLLNPPEQVKLGMTTSVALVQTAASQGFEIPLSAIGRLAGQAIVWRVGNDHSLIAVPVTIEQFGQQSAVVSGSLATQDLIVSAGVHHLDSSMKVRVWEVQQ